jgi:hypothetical protein
LPATEFLANAQKKTTNDFRPPFAPLTKGPERIKHIYTGSPDSHTNKFVFH